MKQLKEELKILDNDLVINDIKEKIITKYCPIYQTPREKTVIEKLVYTFDNEVFDNPNGFARPVTRCIFRLHTDKKSSFVEMYDRNNKIFFEGNFLHSHPESSTEEEHIIFIKRLHSVKNVKENYGG